MAWADDPELLATFCTEVGERLASLSEGLLRLESEGAPRSLLDALFRDAHTVKGSARMLGLDPVVDMAHHAEDLLGAVRDRKVPVSREVIDLLLRTCESIGCAMPDSETPIDVADIASVVDALSAAIDGRPFDVPELARGPEDADEDLPGRSRNGENVRVRASRLYELLDVTGESELELRRVGRRSHALSDVLSEHLEQLAAVRRAASRYALPPELASAVHGLIALEDQLQTGARDLRTGVEDASVRLAQVRTSAMGLAMVPVRRATAGFGQLVREVAHSSGKEVRLVVRGDDVEIDARVLDGVAEALQHLVTNAVDHGCETTAERVAAHKNAQATVTLNARAAGSTVVIEVGDDGAGIDEARIRDLAVERGLIDPDVVLAPGAALSLLFIAGFTTRGDITQTSGRGVGLDVVRTSVEELGGTVEIETEVGSGTRFVITLPVTLGVMRCLVARVGPERYAIPISGVLETVSINAGTLSTVAGAPVILRDGVNVPVADLGTALGCTGPRDTRAAIVVRFGGPADVFAWTVDALEGESEVIVKELGGFLGRPHGLSGATIDNDGAVMLLLDVRELAVAQVGSTIPTSLPETSASRPLAAAALRPRVLVVEDSIGVRELERVILEGAGYEVLTAVDGLDGARRLGHEPVDAVVSDVEMPGMDGFTLTRAIRRTRGWEDVPVVIMTSRGDEADQRAGLDAGASAYLLKSEFDQNELVETVRRLVGR
jgi:chemotaxis protein histidine kinase CheA